MKDTAYLKPLRHPPPLRFALAALFLPLAACGEPEEIAPVLSGLHCEIVYEEGEEVEEAGYRGTFSFDYVDGNKDLDAPGAAVRWWVDGAEQRELPLDERDGSSELGNFGTLSLSLATFPRFEELEVRFTARDGAGQESNALTAILNTDPDYESCTALE